MYQKLILYILFFWLSSTQAAQIAVVITDGAMVYKQSSFDSAVIAYLDHGRKVKISTKTFGPFYRVQLKQGVIGYLADTDVSVEGKTVGDSSPATVKKTKRNGKKQSFLKPVSQRISVGALAGLISYKEVINQAEYSQSMTVFGLKASFPFSVFEGLFQMQVNIFGSMTAPEYYKNYVSGGSPSGRIIWVDSTMDFVLSSLGVDKGAIYLGAGPLINYSQIKIQTSAKDLNLEEAKLGASFVLGVAYWVGPVVLRLEPKYYVERSNYFGVTGSLQIDL